MIELYKGLPLFNAEILDTEEGLVDVSLVDDPAIQRDWIFFSSQEEVKFRIQDEDQHIISGVVLVPNTPIYRRTSEGKEFYIQFSETTIKEMILKMGRENLYNKITLNHENKPVEGVTLVEIFLKDSSKGINPNFIDDVPEGSIFASYKVENEDLWNRIKSGEFKGFSISGLFSVVPVEEKDELDDVLGLIKQVEAKYLHTK